MEVIILHVTPRVALRLKVSATLTPPAMPQAGVTTGPPIGGKEQLGIVATATGVELFLLPVGAYAEVKVFLTTAGNDGDSRRASYGTTLL